MIRTFALLAASACCSAILSAQAIDPDTYKINYFDTRSGDNTVRITNVGTSGGDLCAYISVFRPDQEMAECCACLVTPDGLVTLSVGRDLTRNTLTGVTIHLGVIKIVSAAPTNGACPQVPPKPTPGVRAWGTQIDVTTRDVTESEFPDAGLSAAELSRLDAQCNAIKTVGSGHGVCGCGTPE